MITETANRAAADLLPPDLLPAAARDEILASPLPALILSHSGRNVLFASHAFARRLGQPDGGALKRNGLPRLAPGTQRLEALAQDMPEGRRLERLRFGLGTRPVVLNTLVSPLALSDGTPALLVALVEAHPLMNLESVAPLGEARSAPEAPMPAAAPEAAPVAQGIPAAAPTPEPAPPVVAAPALTPPVALPAAPRPTRFVFTLSREGWIETLSPAFGAALGVAPEALIGQAMASVAGALDRHAGDAIEKAVTAGTTWGGIRLNWPLPEENRAVPVVLSAMPMHGREGFSGFSGFGRCLFDDAQPLAQEAQARLDLTPAPAAPVVPPPAMPAAPLESAAPLPPPSSVSDLQKALLAFAEDDAEAMEPIAPVTPAPVAEPDVAAMAEADRAQDLAARSLTPPPLPLAEAAPVETPESQNVVSLRPGQIELPQGLPPHLARPGLSMSERNAFREIARALGAKFDPDGLTAEAARMAPEEGPQEGPENTLKEAPQEVPEATSAPLPAAAPAQAPQPAHVAEARALSADAFLVDHLPIGVIVLKGEETLFINRTLLDLAGYDDMADFLAQGGLHALFRKGALPRARDEGFDTVVIATRAGEMIPVDAHLQPLEWEGEAASLISLRRAVEVEQGKALTSVAHDLKRVRSEAGELRAVLDTATDGVITLDEGGLILSLNGAAEALFGLNQNEVAGESFTRLLRNESHAEALDYFEGLKANGVKSVLNDGREVAGLEKKGGTIPLFLTLGRISDEEPRRFCAVLRDLTAWKRAEADLTEARRQAENASAKKSDFLAKVGHEIRTPMNAIIGFAEVMQEERLGPVGNPKYKEYLGDIRNSGLHVVSLVNDLLDLSKIEAGRMELNFAATDLNGIVSGCVGIIQPQATQMRVLVRSQLAAKLPPVVADERSIRQIVLNLLSNATRFTPAGGQVLVATTLQENGEAIIRIRDTGVGMSASEIEQALESYRQVGPRRDHGGTGLGLPLSKALAEANRASFSIRSNPGEGTTVEISFPPTRVLAE